MKPLTCRTVIDAPAEKVFAILTDVEKLPERIPDIIRVEKLTPGPVAIGTRFKETRKMFGKEATEEMTFTTFEPNQAYTLGAYSCGTRYTVPHRLTTLPDGKTELQLTFETRAESLFAKVMSPMLFFMKGMMVKKIQADLDAIRKACESA
jgi:uncharacterized protein YndB with AHSA1/START domain